MPRSWPRSTRPRRSDRPARAGEAFLCCVAKPLGDLRHVCRDELLLVLPHVLPAANCGRVSPTIPTHRKGEFFVAILAGCPLLIGMFTLLGGTLLTATSGALEIGNGDGIVRYGRLRRCGLCYFAAAGVKIAAPSNLLFAFFLILMGFMNDLIMAWRGRCVRTLAATTPQRFPCAMNMPGNLFGAASTLLVTGLIMKHIPEPNNILVCFTMYGIVYFIGVLGFSSIDPTKPIVDEMRTSRRMPIEEP